MRHEFIFNFKLHSKKRARISKNRMFTDKKSKSLNDELAYLFRLEAYKYLKKPINQALFVGIYAYFKKPKTSKNEYPIVKPDIDNLIKAVFDVGNGIFWTDDKLITDLRSKKRYSNNSTEYFKLEIITI